MNMKHNDTPFPKPQKANRKSFIDPFNTKQTVAYYHRIFDKYAYASNFGLALDDDDQAGSGKRPVMLEDMFVPPALTPHALTPLSLMEAERNDQAIQGMSNITGMLQQHPWMFVLGDPGTGKSTLITWLMMTLRYSGNHQLKHQVGPLVPFALVLRDLKLQQVRDWDSLWQAFVAANDELMKPMNDNPELCQQLAENGQSIFLIDGLDEVSAAEIRVSLANAIREGMQRFPYCKFMITSRIIGFSQTEWFGEQQEYPEPLCEDDIEEGLIEKGRLSSAKAFEGLPVLYLAPFDQGKQEQFVLNWYRQYVPDQSSHQSLVEDLLSRLSKHDGLSELARIPVLLNMICFIHARRGRLPDGRAELYERIAETYLVSLDSARRIKFQERDMRVDYEDLSEGLAHLALEMQQQRGESNETVHIAKSKVEKCFRDLLIDQGLKEQEAQQETCFILDYIAHRSGLFIPRGEVDGEIHYAFSHLSFLEYFAAKELVGNLLDMKKKDWGQWREKLHQPVWHEVIALWFELLPKKSVKHCAHMLFGVEGEKLKTEESNGWLLLSEIAMNSAVRLSGEQRKHWIESSWKHLLGEKLQSKTPLQWLDSEKSWLSTMWSEHFDSMDAFKTHAIGLAELTLVSPKIDNLSIIEGLEGLKGLNLGDTRVSDFSPLLGLEELRELGLVDARINDLNLLVGFKELVSLVLVDDRIDDLSPLVGLEKLRFLGSICSQISDLNSLSGLEGLSYLSLVNSKVTNLSPLSSFEALSSLNLRNSQVTDLSPLSGLKALSSLNLRNTQVTDLSPLSGLKALSSLDLRDTQVTDLSPLSSLAALSSLDLRNTQVTDLSPLSGLENLKIIQ